MRMPGDRRDGGTGSASTWLRLRGLLRLRRCRTRVHVLMNDQRKQRASSPRDNPQRALAWLFPVVVLVALSGYLRVALPFAIDSGRIAINDVQNTTSVGSSGMPTEHQFSEIAHAGYGVVVNLVPAGSVGAHPDEQGLVERNGMRYVGIPVNYAAPRAADFEQFVRVVRASGDERVLVHCQLGWRASTFVFLYRVVERGEDPDVAFEDVLRVWSPASHWRAFMRDTLRERNKPLPARLAA